MTEFSDWNSGVFCLLTHENNYAFALPNSSPFSDDKRRYTEKKNGTIFTGKYYIVSAIWNM
jgi:hypothetical protein